MAASSAQETSSNDDATLHFPADPLSAQHSKDHNSTIVGVEPSSSPTTPRGSSSSASSSSASSSSTTEPTYMPRRTALLLSELLSPATASGGADNQPTPETDDKPVRVRPTGETSRPSSSPHRQSTPTAQHQSLSKTDNEGTNSSSSSSLSIAPKTCAQCGRDQSPCWRRGPNRTILCNSCGLKFARRVRRAKDEADKCSAKKPHSFTDYGVASVDPYRGVSVLVQYYDPQGRPVSFPVESAAHINSHAAHLQALPQMFSQFQATQVPNIVPAGFPGLAMHPSSVVPVFPSSNPYPMPTRNYLFPESPTPFMLTSPMPMEPTRATVIPAPARSFVSPQTPAGAGPQASQLAQVLSRPYSHQNPSYVSFLLPSMMQHQQQHIELRQSPAEALLKLAQELPSQSALTTAMTTTRLKPATPHLSQPLALPQLTSLSDLIHDSQRYVKQQSTTVGLDKKRKAEASPATSPPILKKSHTDTDARLAVQALVPRPPGRVLKHITELSA